MLTALADGALAGFPSSVSGKGARIGTSPIRTPYGDCVGMSAANRTGSDPVGA